MEKYYHSVKLDKDKCVGCTSCIKRCPTEAIRVRDGKASIIAERCIDCGECIRICPHYAKIAVTDMMSSIRAYKYKIALPAPALYGQFKRLQTVENVYTALREIGFDEVYDVARGADIVTVATRNYIEKNSGTVPKPLISSACPTIMRLIQVRFPTLLDNILPLMAPMEVAAREARKAFCEAHYVKPEHVGVYFITPCAAKMTATHSPLGFEKSEVTGCLSMTEVYGMLSMQMARKKDADKTNKAPRIPQMPTPFGVGWAAAGGEAQALGAGNFLAVDGSKTINYPTWCFLKGWHALAAVWAGRSHLKINL